VESGKFPPNNPCLLQWSTFLNWTLLHGVCLAYFLVMKILASKRYVCQAVVTSQAAQYAEEPPPGGVAITSSTGIESARFTSVIWSPIVHLAGMESCPVMPTVPVHSGSSNPCNSQLLPKLSHPLDGLLRKLPVLTD
jgi:hypothetical protein